MKTVKMILLLFLFSVSTSMSLASAQGLTHFKISQCMQNNCFKAEAAQGYLSKTDSSIYAENVVLNIYRENKHRTYKCASLRYSPNAQYLSCHNQEAKVVSLTIDKNFNIRKY